MTGQGSALLDLKAGAQVEWSVVHTRPLTCCDVSLDGKYVVTGSDVNNAVYVRATETGEIITNLQEQHRSTVTSCCFHPDGQRLASASCDGTARIWDISVKRTTMTLKKHRNVVSDCCFSQSGNILCTASWDRSLLVWDVTVGNFRSHGPRSLGGGHQGCISSCVISSDASLIVAGSYDQTISVWDTAGLYRKLVLKEIPVTLCLCWSVWTPALLPPYRAQCKVRAVPPNWVTMERRWMRMERSMVSMIDHQDWVLDVAISSNNRWILSACKDSTVRLWDIEKIEQIPIVKAERREHGEKVVKCSHCEKPFSRCHDDSSENLTLCVFCRLSVSPRTSLPSVSSLSSPSVSAPRWEWRKRRATR